MGQPLGGGCSPNFQLLGLYPTPAHYWRPVRVGLFQKLTRDASLQLDVQPERSALLFPATLLAPKMKPVHWGIHFFFPPKT